MSNPNAPFLNLKRRMARGGGGRVRFLEWRFKIFRFGNLPFQKKNSEQPISMAGINNDIGVLLGVVGKINEIKEGN